MQIYLLGSFITHVMFLGNLTNIDGTFGSMKYLGD